MGNLKLECKFDQTRGENMAKAKHSEAAMNMDAVGIGAGNIYYYNFLPFLGSISYGLSWSKPR